jgi:DNA-binding IclR family transcriptional regulator
MILIDRIIIAQTDMPKKSNQLSIAEQTPATGGVAAVDKALSLLAIFQHGETALTLSDLAERTAMHKSTCLRLLASLQHAHFIQRTQDGNYALGREISRLQGIYMAGFALGDVVYPVLQALVDKTKESVAYSVIQGTGQEAQRLCLYRVHSEQMLRDHIREGDLLPLSKGAGGRVLLAFSDLSQLDYKSSSKEAKQLAQIKLDGYFAAVGDRSPELAGISAPVFKGNGVLVASLTLTMPSSRYTEKHISDVVAAAGALSQQII